MRVLFQMPATGYLRMYASTLRLLAERGHHVLLSYDRPDKRHDPAAVAVEDHEHIEVVPPLPAAKRRLEPRVEQLRAAADYLRYLDPQFAEARYLRRRLDGHLSGVLRPLVRLRYGHPLARPGLRLALAGERLVPSDARIERAIAALSPDVVLITPLVGRSERNRRQTDTVKAARKLGLPVAAGIASWDHLTTKGIVKAQPDKLFVWNEIQRREAVELHRVPQERIVVTGAQLFDGWFDRGPSTSREEFLGGLGLDPATPVVLYVGSSPNIAPPEREIAFVREWLSAVRELGVGVLVRPHPYSVAAWAEVELEGAAVAPRVEPQLPMTDEDEALYFDSIHHAAAVVGINTSAMVESFIQRKPVLTIRAPEFHDTQAGTLHFRHLLEAPGGALQVAASPEEHLAQLRATLEAPDARRDAIEEFLRAFVRPLGLDRPATPILVDSIECLTPSGV